MIEERWLPIKGYEGIYLISDHGRVLSLDRIIIRSDGQKYSVKQKILANYVRKCYWEVKLWRNGSVKTVKVHRLVIQHFGPNRPSAAHEVNHKDGDKTNNHISNLEWVTRSENVKHAYSIGLLDNKPKGELCSNTHLSDVEVIAIRELYKESDFTQRQIAAACGVSQTCIKRILLHETWKHLP